MAEEVFSKLFSDLENENANIRAEESQVLLKNTNNIQKLISIYQESLNSEPKRASLAGQVL